MCVLPEMTIGAVHPLFHMDVLKMNRLSEFVGICRRNDLIFGVEQIAFTIFLVDLLKHPTVPVCIGELDSLQLLIKKIGAGRL